MLLFILYFILITEKERERETYYFIIHKVIFYFIQVYLSIVSTIAVSLEILIKTKRKVRTHQ